MLTFLDAEVELAGDDVAWALELECSPLWIAARDDDERRQFGGVFVTPARTAMGLRGWEDAHEGITDDGEPWVLFDLEKLIRMALRQSGLAFDFLTAPATWAAESFPARTVAKKAVTRDIVGHYLDVARPLLDDDQPSVPGHWKSLLFGWALATRAEVSHDLETLEELADADGYSRAESRRLFAEAEAGTALPERPSDYDGLNEMLVDARMEAT